MNRRYTVVALYCALVWSTGSCTATSTSSTVTSSPSSTAASATATPSNVLGGWTIVALGDSFTKTQNSEGHTYLDLFGDALARSTGVPVTVDDLSDDGNTSDLLAENLANDDATRAAVADADIVLVSVGGNDSDPFGIYPAGTCSPVRPIATCLHAYSPRFAGNYQHILESIESLRAGQPTSIRVTSADNPFVGWSEAPRADFGVRFYRLVAEAQTATACRIARAHGGLCLDYLHIFTGPEGDNDPKPYLGADHAHPGDRGIQTIADELLHIGVPELSDK